MSQFNTLIKIPLLKPYLFLILLLGFIIQTKAQDSLQQKAMIAIQTQDWTTAIQLFSAHLKTNDEDAKAWYFSGFSKVKIKHYKTAISDLLRAKALNYSPAIALDFNLAKCYAQTEKPKHALELLDSLSKQGFSSANRLQDSAFDPIRSSPKFQSVLQQVNNNAYPCSTSAAHRRFDFWIGEWDVFANGNKVGENTISKANGGCAIHESYTTPGSYTGQSINFYDPIDQKWKQHWVGSSGDVSNYVENEPGYEGDLQFLAKQMTANGAIIHQRMTFSYQKEQDTVRQLIESSTDEGKTWTIAFDGLYKRKNSSSN